MNCMKDGVSSRHSNMVMRGYPTATCLLCRAVQLAISVRMFVIVEYQMLRALGSMSALLLLLTRTVLMGSFLV
jgi:hypothetical protein